MDAFKTKLKRNFMAFLGVGFGVLSLTIGLLVQIRKNIALTRKIIVLTSELEKKAMIISQLQQKSPLFDYKYLCVSLVYGLLMYLVKLIVSEMFSSDLDVKPCKPPTTRFSDVKGVDEAKAELQHIVCYLQNPARYNCLGAKIPKGVLLAGPPGGGKTMLVRAIAGEAGVPFFACSGSQFDEMFVGVGARRVRKLFAAAKKTMKKSPCIIFIDEIDAVGKKRTSETKYTETLNQLLVELDGFTQDEKPVIVIGATNRLDTLDEALIRPGRFDLKIVVPNPDVKGRQEIMESHVRKDNLEENVDLSVIAKGTPGFSGAELANLVNLAALKAAEDGLKAVRMADFEYAKDKIIMGSERKSAVISKESRELTAFHEGGHALVAIYTDGALPVHKATIVPRGNSLGMVSQLPDGNEMSFTRQQLLAKLDVLMGGRVAEELIFGVDKVTTGASSDFKEATSLALEMITKYGMGTQTRFVNYDKYHISAETKRLVEEEVEQFLYNAHENAKLILEAHKEELHALAKAHMKRETLTGYEIKRLLSETTCKTSKRMKLCTLLSKFV